MATSERRERDWKKEKEDSGGGDSPPPEAI